MEGSMILPGSAYQLPWYLWDGASDPFFNNNKTTTRNILHEFELQNLW